MERLQDIVTTRRIENGWPHPPTAEKDPHIQQCTGCQNTAEERGIGRRRQRCTFKEDLEEMGVSWHGARMIASNRDRWRLMSPDASRGTGGSK